MMTTPTTNTLISWTGWTRQGRGRWRLYCRGATYDAVVDQLLNVRLGVDKLVRQGDADPNVEAPRR